MIADAPPPYRTIAFDCDSTLSAIEGIDELAGAHAEEIAALTRAAMSGQLALEAVYSRRLETIQPTQAEVERVGRLYVARLLPHARELCAALRFLGKRVVIVSGGIKNALEPLAQALDVRPPDLFSVALEFDADGRFAGFDPDEPLAQSGGKPLVLAQIAAHPPGPPSALVGDGITDLEAAAQGGIARFVAFGGVVRRTEVFARAAVSSDKPDLAALVPLLLSEREQRILSRSGDHAALMRAAHILNERA